MLGDDGRDRPFAETRRSTTPTLVNRSHTPSEIGHARRPPVTVLAAAFLFNLGQGVLRPAMPLYLQRTFAANYRMVTLIPVMFGAGKWIANIPTGYLLDRLGHRLMICGLLMIALVDVASIATSRYDIFLGLRALGGAGWAMFATVATTSMVNMPAAQRRGRAVSLLLMTETSGLLLGTAAGGWLYHGVGISSPFLFEAACMVAATAAIAGWAPLTPNNASASREPGNRRLLGAVVRTPGVLLMGITNALLIAIQTGVLVFLFPLYLVKRGGVGPEAVGLVVSLSVLGRLMALWLGGSFSDRWGRMRVLVPGLAVYGAMLGSMALLTHPAALGVLSFAVGAASGFVAAIPTAFTSDQVERSLHGVAIGWLRTMSDGGQIVGPLVMGTLADAVDLSAPFLIGAVLLAAAAWECHRRANTMSPAVVAGGRDS
jgi:DHA1 family multidrug resistance protein-like MFS transporter